MVTEWTAEKMHELGTLHARLETEGDLEGTMKTLVADPVYEFWPIGLRARGSNIIRRYYEHLMQVFMPSLLGSALLEEWLTEKSLAQEYSIELNGPDGPETHHVIGILWAEGELMGGERIWGSEACLRAMVGPLFDELERIGDD